MDLLTKQKEAIVKSIEMLETNYLRLGRPQFDIKSKAFWEFFEILVDYWHIAYPLEYLEWLDTREMDLVTEKTLQEQVKSGLHKSYAFPLGLFNLIKTYWRKADLMDKEFATKFKRRFPIFRNSKYS
jgi:hypothetical protein